MTSPFFVTTTMSMRAEQLTEDLKRLIQQYIIDAPEEMSIEEVQSDLTGALMTNLCGVYEDGSGSDAIAHIVAAAHVLIRAKQEKGDML
jgi:hypothetical protein